MKPAVGSFIALAKEDLAVARRLLAVHPRHSAFALEQAAEKLLKAVLTAEGISFTASHHQLGRLADLLPADHIWRADLMAFDSYTSFATATRYPRPGGGMPQVPSREVLEAGLKEVSSLVSEIEDWCREKDD
ncbi:MAG TPA: HEPN domain-containing protein [Xanthobacteraceae bacterium]|nr:HEPN domain-containing protein [Xanthobacteraceae bacterium]